MQDFVIESFKEELIEAAHWHALAVISGNESKQRETLAKLEEAYTHFRHIDSPKAKHGN